MDDSHLAHARAESLFKRNVPLLTDAEKARADYEAQQAAVNAKTAKLRAARLARDAAERPIRKQEPGGR